MDRRRTGVLWDCACAAVHLLLVGQVFVTLLVSRTESATLSVSSSAVTVSYNVHLDDYTVVN